MLWVERLEWWPRPVHGRLGVLRRRIVGEGGGRRIWVCCPGVAVAIAWV